VGGVEIAGRVALVTGAAAGAGRGIARRLADEGAEVVVADLDAPGDWRFIRTDVTDDAQLAAAIREARPSILVNNAGGGGHVEPHFPDGDWSAWLDLNLRAPMLATQLALEVMDEGAVVNIASTAGIDDDPHPSAEYAAAKAGLIRFTTAFRQRNGVRVNCVVPDWILTERAEAELASMSDAERAAAPPPIRIEDIAAAVETLIADGSLAGRVLVLRGGAAPRLI
jgi:NAD(P)-dependent dehydrogenase (short-subunit alcohol dehydrogenase family)